jgi:glycosyltransferase involved in cell wall biosynthesis
VIVHQILAAAGPFDAVTGQALAFRRCFDDWGWGGGDFASYVAPGTSHRIVHRGSLRAGEQDVLLVHHSAVLPGADELLSGPQPLLLVYHNITPPEWLWDVAPALGVHCAVGRMQLPDLVGRADVSAAVSEFNAEELRQAGARDPIVLPPLISPDHLTAGGPQILSLETPSILFVGRLSPHKRQDAVIQAFALYRRRHAPGAQLHLVGSPIGSAYPRRLHELADRVAPGAIHFESGLSQSDIAARYRNATAFLCLSEHEGFCLPIIEALAAGLPVVARRAGAVPETLGDAGLILEPDDDLGVVAEALHAVISDEALRDALARRGAARVAAYSPDVAMRKLRAAVEAAVGVRSAG